MKTMFVLKMLCVAIVVVSCRQSTEQIATPTTTAAPTATTTTTTTTTAVQKPVVQESRSDEQQAVDVIERYYKAIASRNFKEAYQLWGENGPPGQSLDQFTRGFAETATVDVKPGAPSRIDAAAGSRYIEVPVVVTSTLKSGVKQTFEGSYSLRRSVVDGATAAQRSWHLYKADLRVAGAPTFVDRVWRVTQSSSVERGTLYEFRSDGTLIIRSAHSTPMTGSWRRSGKGLVMVEESISYPTDILRLTSDSFVIRSHNPGAPVDITMEPADKPTTSIHGQRSRSRLTPQSVARRRSMKHAAEGSFNAVSS